MQEAPQSEPLPGVRANGGDRRSPPAVHPGRRPAERVQRVDEAERLDQPPEGSQQQHTERDLISRGTGRNPTGIGRYPDPDGRA